jgi:hypothetical protein
MVGGRVPSDRSRLDLDAERVREPGCRTVDALVDWICADSRPPHTQSAGVLDELVQRRLAVARIVS